MSIMATNVVEDLLVYVGEIQCFMTFMIVDINNHDILLGLD